MAARRDPAPRDPYRDPWRSRSVDPAQSALPLDDEVFALAWSGDVPGVLPERGEALRDAGGPDDPDALDDPPLPRAWSQEGWDDDRWDVPGQGELALELPDDALAATSTPAPPATTAAARGTTSATPVERAGQDAAPARGRATGTSGDGTAASGTSDGGTSGDGGGHGRAGRDLKAAIGVGVLLAGLICVTLFTYRPAFVVVVAAAVVIGTREVVGALRVGGAEPSLPPTAAAGAGLVVAAYLGGGQALATGLLLAVLALAAIGVARDPRTLRRDLPASAFAVAYVGFLAGFAMLLLRPDDGVWRVVTFIAVTVCSDIGGYATGVLSGGRHKLAPSISPGKSWEGLAGSVLVCGIAGALFVSLALGGGVAEGVLLGVAVAVAATVGDLGESALKRDVGVKDMGSLLPGHGGIMDRLDSLLTVAPVAWGLLALLVPVA